MLPLFYVSMCMIAIAMTVAGQLHQETLRAIDGERSADYTHVLRAADDEVSTVRVTTVWTEFEPHEHEGVARSRRELEPETIASAECRFGRVSLRIEPLNGALADTAAVINLRPNKALFAPNARYWYLDDDGETYKSVPVSRDFPCAYRGVDDDDTFVSMSSTGVLRVGQVRAFDRVVQLHGMVPDGEQSRRRGFFPSMSLSYFTMVDPSVGTKRRDAEAAEATQFACSIDKLNEKYFSKRNMLSHYDANDAFTHDVKIVRDPEHDGYVYPDSSILAQDHTTRREGRDVQATTHAQWNTFGDELPTDAGWVESNFAYTSGVYGGQWNMDLQIANYGLKNIGVNTGSVDTLWYAIYNNRYGLSPGNYPLAYFTGQYLDHHGVAQLSSNLGCGAGCCNAQQVALVAAWCNGNGGAWAGSFMAHEVGHTYNAVVPGTSGYHDCECCCTLNTYMSYYTGYPGGHANYWSGTSINDINAAVAPCRQSGGAIQPGSCVSADTQVVLQDGKRVSVNELKAGDFVRTPAGTEEVEMILHRSDASIECVEMCTDAGACVRVSPTHYVRDTATGELRQAADGGDWSATFPVVRASHVKCPGYVSFYVASGTFLTADGIEVGCHASPRTVTLSHGTVHGIYSILRHFSSDWSWLANHVDV